MIRQSTIELLKEMRFSAMVSELERQLADEETYREMSFEDRLAMLVDAEWNRRQSNKYTRCLHNARFAIPNATIEGIEYHEDRKLNRKQMLQFASCQYIESGHHIILSRKAGIRELIPNRNPVVRSAIPLWIVSFTTHIRFWLTVSVLCVSDTG